jgi:hypothetical protein
MCAEVHRCVLLRIGGTRTRIAEVSLQKVLLTTKEALTYISLTTAIIKQASSPTLALCYQKRVEMDIPSPFLPNSNRTINWALFNLLYQSTLHRRTAVPSGCTHCPHVFISRPCCTGGVKVCQVGWISQASDGLVWSVDVCGCGLRGGVCQLLLV